MNSRALAVAFAATVAILWVVCGLIILLVPNQMTSMSGHMVHTDLSGTQWHMPIAGFLVGGLAWVIVAGLTGYLVGWIYNRLNGPEI